MKYVRLSQVFLDDPEKAIDVIINFTGYGEIGFNPTGWKDKEVIMSPAYFKFTDDRDVLQHILTYGGTAVNSIDELRR